MSHRILIVDDNGKNIQLLGNLLMEAGYTVEYAFNGQLALQWLQRADFDAILLDIMMPEMDGFETCARIKQMPSRMNIPVIFITARDDTDSITKAFRIGGVDYLTKPFNREELLARLATHVELKMSREKLIDTTHWLAEEVRMKTEEIRKAKEELEEAYNELKLLDLAQNEFLKSISHEIRTPLTGIVGSLSLLSNYQDSEEMNEVVNLLEKSVQKLEKYSYTALQIAFLRLRGVDRNEFIEVNISAIVKNCVGLYLQQAKDKGVVIRFKTNAPGVVVKGDHDLLIQAVKALIESSVVFSHEGNIDVTITESNDGVWCSIADEGTPFSNDTPVYMFDSMNSKGWTHDRNTSLELHLAQIILLSHGGTLLFRNNEHHKGTITSFFLKK